MATEELKVADKRSPDSLRELGLARMLRGIKEVLRVQERGLLLVGYKVPATDAILKAPMTSLGLELPKDRLASTFSLNSL